MGPIPRTAIHIPIPVIPSTIRKGQHSIIRRSRAVICAIAHLLTHSYSTSMSRYLNTLTLAFGPARHGQTPMTPRATTAHSGEMRVHRSVVMDLPGLISMWSIHVVHIPAI